MQALTSTELTERLKARRQEASAVLGLSRCRTRLWLDQLLGLLFPQREENITPPAEVEARLATLEQDLASLLSPLDLPATLATTFFGEDLPRLDAWLLEDAQCIYQGDPAATSLDEVILSYPGFLAVAIYRLANALRQRDVPILPRMLTEHGHQLTGIDIHPGASIGRRFCIDHGTGVVIGESSWIGDGVKLYQGVTLGALSVDKQMADTKRHPTIEDGVVIYANATILGGETRIGHHSVIGGNVWLTRSVDPHSLVYHTPQIQVRSQQSSPLEFHI
ncbi:MAG: serine acetyltransferase [Candidatus Melainabacteria bacterium HGW-Melainabacteria-1]|nr:MAG: serine acetyltransferase [Candidatus Melainabacteria bacterium HGW-Melainabacteria-1]